MKQRNSTLQGCNLLIEMRLESLQYLKGGNISHASIAMNLDIQQETVITRKPRIMRRRCNKQESSFKQTNREDNHTPSTQIISIVTVICAMNLDIKLLNVMCN